MSAEDVFAGLVERVRTVAGLTVVEGLPDTIQKARLAAVFFRGGTGRLVGTLAGSSRTNVWRFGVRVYVNQHDNTLAEREAMRFASEIDAALNADRYLLDRSGNRRAEIIGDFEHSADGPDGYFVTEDGVRYRADTVLFDVTERLP